ncbi:hypothetical protein RB195_009577 [Necator americanus]|uniref:Peptidase S1 domain-containing protein n=1 Tax=Necator americanus TaxID=51031 RepID=A0ABR1CVS7_NECAM
MITVLILTVLAATVTSHKCGKPPIPPRDIGKIVGGTIARPYSWPWQIELCAKRHNRTRCELRCGGTLIDNEWVMSAGHCVRHYENNTKFFGIKLGTYDFRDDNEDGEVLRNVIEIHTHPEFSQPHRFSHDISLLRLSQPVSYTKHIQPICISRKKRELSLEKTGIVTGWGTTSEGGPVSDKLRQVTVPFLSRKECEREYNGEIDDSMTCAGRRGVDSCQGDSGGPLVVKHEKSDTWYQVGIVSWGEGCGEQGHAGVYSCPSFGCDFIEKTIGKRICVD